MRSINCKHCQKEYQPKDTDKGFCSKSCSTSYHNHLNPKRKSKKDKSCISCGIVYRAWSHTSKYCSNTCQMKFEQRKIITEWLQNPNDPDYSLGITGYLSRVIKKYLLDQADNKCSKCGWCEKNPFTYKVPLDIDHKDGNSDNNHPDNLQVLCPNCHALTQSYKGANAGRHKPSRRTLYYRKYFDFK